MRFEHLVEINDPANPLIQPLSRAQLWQGLMHRVEDPVPFLPGLETCVVLERSGTELLRELNFGAAVIHDRVTFSQEQWVRFAIVPSKEHAGGDLTITIEEPQPGHLFLRFAYRTTLAETAGSEEAGYVEYVKSAYHESDLDCVRLIRTLAAGGMAQ